MNGILDRLLFHRLVQRIKITRLSIVLEYGDEVTLGRGGRLGVSAILPLPRSSCAPRRVVPSSRIRAPSMSNAQSPQRSAHTTALLNAMRSPALDLRLARSSACVSRPCVSCQSSATLADLRSPAS